MAWDLCCSNVQNHNTHTTNRHNILWHEAIYSHTVTAVFKPGVCSQRLRAPSFLKLLYQYACVCVCVYVCVCVSVCVSAPESTNNQWCDMVWYRLCVWHKVYSFPLLLITLWHLPSIEWMDVAILTQHVVNACQRKLRWCGTSYETTTQKMERIIYKVSGQMRRTAFKRRPAFGFTVIISA